MHRIKRLQLTKVVYAAADKLRVGQQAMARPISSVPPAFNKLGCLNSRRGQNPNEKNMSTGLWQRPLDLLKIIRDRALQSVRPYAKVNTLMYDCWFCENRTPKKNAVLCQNCGNIQDVESRIDYFALLNMPQTFILNEYTLSKNLSQVKTILQEYTSNIDQRKEHERSYAVAWGQILDLAYETLADPYKRAEYMLSMYGYSIPGFTSDSKLILEIKEKNIEVEEAETVQELQSLLNDVNLYLSEHFAQLSMQLNNMELEAACKTLDNMRYYRTLLYDMEAKKKKLVKAESVDGLTSLICDFLANF